MFLANLIVNYKTMTITKPEFAFLKSIQKISRRKRWKKIDGLLLKIDILGQTNKELRLSIEK